MSEDADRAAAGAMPLDPADLALVYFAAADSLRVLEARREPRDKTARRDLYREIAIARANARRAENNLRGAVGAPLLPEDNRHG